MQQHHRNMNVAASPGFRKKYQKLKYYYLKYKLIIKDSREAHIQPE
jgi:hypothetical protein